jgi:tetratricopeptide (TPR) repeat protein
LANVLERQGKDPEAMYDQALAEFQKLAADVPDVPDYEAQAAAAYSKRATLFAARNRPGDAEESYKQARAIRLKLAAAVPESLDYRGLLGDSHFDLGFFFQNQTRPKEAEPELTRARDLYAGLHAEFPAIAVYQRHLALACNNLGNALWSNGRPDDAARSFAQARDLQKDLVGKLPQERADRFHLARYFHNLGLLQLNRLRQAEESIASFVEARALLKKLVEELPDDAAYRTFLGEIHGDLGRAYVSRDMLAEAQPCLEEAVAELKKVLKVEPENLRLAQTLATQYQALLQILVGRKDHAAARTIAAELIDVLPGLADNHVVAAWTLASCIPLVQRDPRLSRAVQDKQIDQLSQQAVAALRQAHQRGRADMGKLLVSAEWDPLRERSEFKRFVLEVDRGKK